jgi:hypothetical protein
LGQRLGFDMPTIALMAEGRENFEKLRQAALAGNPFTNENYELADKTDKMFRKAHRSIETLYRRIAVALMPSINKMLERFIAWTKESNTVNKLSNAMETVVSVLESLWNNLGKIGAVFGALLVFKMGAYFVEWGEAAAKAAKAMTTVAGAGSLLKSLIVGGLAAAIFLVAEDLWTFYRGGRSVTGLLLTKFPFAVEQVKLVLAGLSAVLIGMVTGSGPLGLFILGIGGLIIAAQDLRDSWNPVMQWLQETWDDLADTIARDVNAIASPIRALAGLAGVSIPEMDEHHGATRNKRFNEDALNRLAPYSSLGGPMADDGRAAPWSMFPSKGSATNQTTNIGTVNFTMPNVTGGKESAREAYRELTRLAHGGVGG